jgi:hypothetical protein
MSLFIPTIITSSAPSFFSAGTAFTHHGLVFLVPLLHEMVVFWKPVL